MFKRWLCSQSKLTYMLMSSLGQPSERHEVFIKACDGMLRRRLLFVSGIMIAFDRDQQRSFALFSCPNLWSLSHSRLYNRCCSLCANGACTDLPCSPDELCTLMVKVMTLFSLSGHTLMPPGLTQTRALFTATGRHGTQGGGPRPPCYDGVLRHGHPGCAH